MYNMDVGYIKKIQQWVQYDNIILKNKEDIKEIIDKKKELEDEILDYVEKNKYDKLTLNITDGNIKFSKRNVTQPLSMKTLRSIFEKYNNEGGDLDITEIMKYISESLETKQKIHMQRDIIT